MNFTFVRAERSQEENQERAFIAASRRQDRDFKQRLESLQKASELHFARTGKRFEVTQAQVEHNGPLMELGDDEKKRRKARRFAPYVLNRPRGGSNIGQDIENMTNREISGDNCSLTPIQTGQLDEQHASIAHQSPRFDQWYPNILMGPEKEDNEIPVTHQQGGVPEIELLITQTAQEVVADDEPTNSHLDDLPTSFFEIEDWQGYHDRNEDQEMQRFLDIHFDLEPPKI